MSKIKSPQEKKALSLKRDRRNTYGENPEASRKGILRGKQRSHMGERRAVGQILTGLRERAEESDAIEADVLAKATIVESQHSAFKKTPDVPLGVVVKRKLEKRLKTPQSSAEEAAGVFPNIYSEQIFDTPYIRALHKRLVMFHVRSHIDPKGWARNRKKTEPVRKHERTEAARWKEAILRDAPLLKGFFVEEPQLRDKMLGWCERVLTS